MFRHISRKVLPALLLCAAYVTLRPANLYAEPIAILGSAALAMPASDEREVFDVSAYTGFAIDTFAAQEHSRYLNYSDSIGTKERGIGGIDFAYRATHRDSGRWPLELWVMGGTLYGVRSAEVDCTKDKNKELSICRSILVNPGERTLYLMRNASSVEGFAGMRFEFLSLNRGHETEAHVYIKSHLGFMTVAKADNDAIDDHTWAAVGGIITKGNFRNSYLEVGRGRTQVFKDAPGDRWKFDGYLEMPFLGNLTKDWVRPFAQMYVNVDNGPHSDSVQTFFGVNFDIKKLFGAW